MIRVAAMPGLTSGQFRHGPVHVAGQWRQVDPADAGVRKTLLGYVGTHIRVHPDDHRLLGGFDLAVAEGRLVEFLAPPPAPAPSSPPRPPPPPLELEAEPPSDVLAPAPAPPVTPPTRRRRT